MFWIAHDNVVQDLDFEELPRPNEVAGHFDVRFRRLRLSAHKGPHQAACDRGRKAQYQDDAVLTKAGASSLFG